MNVVVLRGVLSSDPQQRTLGSGSTLVQFQVTTPVDPGRSFAAARATQSAQVSVPVAWFDPPRLAAFGAGDEVVIVGSVARRFFRTGAGTQSRTEVVATTVLRASNRQGVARALGVLDRIER